MESFDIAVSGGRIMDPNSGMDTISNIGISGGVIAEISPSALEAEEVFDASGQVVCPGFIDTPMTAVNRFRMPLLLDADRAADIIRRGLARNRGRIAFPWQLHALTMLFAVLPGAIVDPMLRRMPRKD